MNLKPVFFTCGVLLLVLAIAMLAPMLADLSGGSTDWQIFAVAQIATTFIGFLLIFANREKEFDISTRGTFLAMVLGWVLLAVFGAIPFCLTDPHLTPSQGFFEAMSGITSTGLTVIPDLDRQPHGLLIWRALLQWLGGIGGLVAALAILPLLQISGQQVFRAQSLDVSKILPKSSQMAVWICAIYIGLTLLCAFLLGKTGMSNFEAFAHAMAAISTGGFSTSSASISHFDNPRIEFILMCFMLLGSLPFTLYLRMSRGDAFAIFRDSQVRGFFGLTLFFVFLQTAYLLFSSPLHFSEALRHAAFKIVSLSTTTGFSLQDGALWGSFAMAICFVAAFTGGCSGSAAGGIRFFRLQILYEMLKLQVKKLIEPNGVFQVYYNKKPVDADIQNAISVFLVAWILVLAFTGTLLMLTGLNFVPAFTSAFSALTNTGPAFQGLGVSVADYSHFDAPALWTLSTGMLMGRVEIFAVFVLFSRRFWNV